MDLPDAAEIEVLPRSVDTPAPRDPWGASADLGNTHDPHEVTVQLEAVVGQSGIGLGQARNGGAGTGDGADGPVFVDASGRRSRRFRRIGMAVAVACAVYAAVIVATLMSGNSNAPWLPVPGQRDDAPASRVDASPLPPDPPDPAQPSAPGRAAPRTGASASDGTAPSPRAGADVPSASTSPDRPGTSADPKPSATQTTKKPGSGGTVPSRRPSASASPTPDPSPTGGVEPTGDPSPTPPGGSPDPTTGTVADGPNTPMPVTGGPSSPSSPPARVL
ncbi:hypothetical protein [Streptomyces sp. NPDC001020]